MKISIIARRAIIERIELPYNGILLLCLKFHYIVQCNASIMTFQILYIFSDLNTSVYILICMQNNVSVPTSYVAGQNCNTEISMFVWLASFLPDGSYRPP